MSTPEALQDVNKTAQEIAHLPTASKLRLAADILEKMELGETSNPVTTLKIARNIVRLAARELEQI